MKAVIMAGGEGTRLRPVTGRLPKPLVPMLGRPMIEHIVLLLKQHGFTDICVAVKYRAEDIMNCLGDGKALGVSIQYRIEDAFMGTAGAVKNCADFFKDEDFLVISGDAACDFDLSQLYSAHESSGAAVTLALYRCPEPLSFGLAVTDSGGFVRSFIEKPDWHHVVTDLVNTGIYIISPRAMKKVPANTKYDFAKELFPLLMSNNEKILGVPMEGYWCDVGTPLAYYRCCVDALEGRLAIDAAESFTLPPNTADAEADEALERTLLCPCHSRAELMGALSAELMDMGADYSDGLCLKGRRYELRISPYASQNAIAISVNAQDAEFARELALSVKALAESYLL